MVELLEDDGLLEVDEEELTLELLDDEDEDEDELLELEDDEEDELLLELLELLDDDEEDELLLEEELGELEHEDDEEQQQGIPAANKVKLKIKSRKSILISTRIWTACCTISFVSSIHRTICCC